MNKSILIVDDDQDFSDLLKGIFQQANYTVHTAFSAEQGFELLKTEHIELVVTDHRLPGGITGTEFLAKLREIGVNLPVIVVSGFLNDEAIRELIRDGVAGIFIKPLNIFSLLKKASLVLEEEEKGKGFSSNGQENANVKVEVGQVEGLSETGKSFLQKARNASAFKRNLLLIGPNGTLFEEIARDIANMAPEEQRIVTLTPGGVNKERLEALFTGESGEQPVTLVLANAEKYSPEEVDTLVELGDERGGSESSLRMIFCLSQSVEDLYDSELIDEEFYLFLGTNELNVPRLKKMPEDLLTIAKKEIEKQSPETVFDMKLRSLLLAHDWPENMVELRSVIVRAVTLAQPMAPQVRHFAAALNPANEGDPSLNDARSTFERFLIQEKSRYESALDLACQS
ncbi:MAG: sigma-54-dependent transcriptional regulator [Puniceicoccaceae bacterium]